MKKRKLGAMLALLCVSMMTFSACGSGSASSSDSTETEITSADADTDDSVETTIEEQVLIDQDGLKITATEYVTDSIWGDGINLLIENNGSSDVGIGCDAVIVNDYMLSDLFSSTVTAGNKANETVDLYSSQLEEAGIENVGKIELYFHTYDPSTYMTIQDFDCVTIETSNFASMDTTANEEGQELYNANGVRIVGKYVNESSFWGMGVLLYIENTSGQEVTVSCESMSVNGFMVNPFFSSNVYDGKKAISEATIFESDLEANGITEVETIEIKFNIYDQNYSTIDQTDAITVTL